MQVKVRTKKPTKLAFVGYDASKRNTYYFARDMQIYGEQTVNFPMPQTPAVLTLKVLDKSGWGNNVEVVKIDIKPMADKTAGLAPNVRSFVKFAQAFSAKAGYLSQGFYLSKDEKYIIWLKKNIDNSGTPAKINRRTGVIKVSIEAIQKYTVPMRMFILLHEYMHYYHQTKNEFKADDGALRMYKQLGYPKSEGNYAMTKIFSDTPMARQRAKRMHQIFKEGKAA